MARKEEEKIYHKIIGFMNKGRRQGEEEREGRKGRKGECRSRKGRLGLY